MIDWTVEMHRETGGGEPGRHALDAYLAALTAQHARVTATAHGRVSPRLTVSAPDVAAAARIAVSAEETAAAAAGLEGVVTAVVATDASTPDGEATWVRTPLLNLTAIGKRLGVSRQRAGQLAQDHPRFPAPVEAAVPLYEEAAIEAFADAWDRKTGRPPRTRAAPSG